MLFYIREIKFPSKLCTTFFRLSGVFSALNYWKHKHGGFLNRERHGEPPTAFADHMEEQEQEGCQYLRLKFAKSPENRTSKTSGSSSQEEIRFRDPNEKRPKVFELHLRKDIPKLVKKCQRKCCRKIEQDCFAVVRSYGESIWTDSKGNEN